MHDGRKRKVISFLDLCRYVITHGTANQNETGKNARGLLRYFQNNNSPSIDIIK